MSRSFLWLTAAEARELSAELNALVDRYDLEDRDAIEHPKDTRRLVCMLAIVAEARHVG
jgi:hypothetical protein